MVEAFEGEGSSDWQLCIQDLMDVLNKPGRPSSRPARGVPALAEFDKLNRLVRRCLEDQIPAVIWRPEETREVLTRLLLSVRDDDYGRKELLAAKVLLGLREPPAWDEIVPFAVPRSAEAGPVTLEQLRKECKLGPDSDFNNSIKLRRAYLAPMFVAGSTQPSTFRNTGSTKHMRAVAEEVLRELLPKVIATAKARAESRESAEAGANADLATLADENVEPVERAEADWYDLEFKDQRTEERVRAFAQELIETVPRAIKHARAYLAATPLADVHSIFDISERLDLLSEIEESLERFSPAIFGQDLEDVKRVTGENPQNPLNGANDPLDAWGYLRPGVKVRKMSRALAALEEQQAEWRRLVPPSILPQVPIGIISSRAYIEVSMTGLRQLDQILGNRDSDSVTRLPIDTLTRGLLLLAAGSK